MMDDFSRRIFFDYLAKRNFAKTIREYSDNPSQKVLLEATAVWVMIQAAIAEDVLNEPKVELWGMQNIDNWQNLNNKQKMNELLQLWSKEGGTKKARNLIDHHPMATRVDDNGWIYDIEDVLEPHDAEIDEHQRQLKKSEVFNDLKELFLSYLERHIDEEQ